MSSRTYICIPCKTARRAEAAYGVNTDLRCSHCAKPLWELEWRWRIPKKNDKKGWKELEEKVSKETAEWLPRKKRIGNKKIEDIKIKISRLEEQKESENRNRKIKLLRAELRQTEKKYIEQGRDSDAPQ